MPEVTQTVQRTVTETVYVGVDRDGKPLNVGDTVFLGPFVIRGMREQPDPETGLPSGEDLLSLAFVKPNGYAVHVGTFSNTLAQKVEK